MTSMPRLLQQPAELRRNCAAAFPPYAEPWGRLGLWLSLWDDKGECVLSEPPGTNHFWATLARHASGLRRRMRELAGRGAAGTTLPGELHACGGLLAIALPVRMRGWPPHYVLVCAKTPAFREQDNLLRFCDRNEIDSVLIGKLAEQVPAYSIETMTAYADILRQQMADLGTSVRARGDIHDLSDQLARSYEELNLIYRVSNGLGLSRRPLAHLGRLCRELLDVTVVRGFAGVLEPTGDATCEPMLVTAGSLDVDSADILKLYRQIIAGRQAPESVKVVNHVDNDPAYAWAAEWLERFVYFPLARANYRYGAILAINQVNGDDFGSEEVQLINTVVERSAAFLENVRLYDDLEQLFMGMLHALVNSIDAKDPYTCGHSQRVAWLSRYIAELAGIPEPQRQRVYLSGLLHDVGKIGITDTLLCKTGKLTDEEYQEIKHHPIIGARILEGMKQVEDLVPGVEYHHERIDGKGYSAGLSGDDIPLFGRVVGLADSLDAMTTNRTYRAALPLQLAVAEIRRFSGTQFDPRLVDLLLQDDWETLFRKLPVSNRSPDGQGIIRAAH
ncbi:MAG: HD-GYP domain-containing protein [Phycisphaerales bacterium]|nr:HD-GYP domain-containing protein [Phycisphaerales bacterium]